MPRVSRKKGVERFALVHSLYNQGIAIDKIADTLNLTMASTRRMLKHEHYSDYLEGKQKPQQMTLQVPAPSTRGPLLELLTAIETRLDVIDEKLNDIMEKLDN